MKTEDEVQHLIDEWTPRCIAFIENGGRGEVNKRIRRSDRKIIEASVGEKCPTCPTEMIPTGKGRTPTKKGNEVHPSSITVEHVVPRILGGNNKRDNLVAMCHQCNKYRNATMTVSIPNLPEMRGKSLSREEISQVSRFIEWSIRTIHSPSSKKVDIMGSEIFENFVAKAKKTRSSVVPKKPVIFSTDNNQIEPDGSLENNSIGELVELLREISDTQKAILEQLQKSLFRRLIDWLATPFRLISKKIRLRHKISKSISTSKQEIFDTQPPEETFEETIEHLLLGEGSILVSYLGNKLRKYQKENNWDDVGSGALLVKHGMGKKFGLKNAILKLMPDRVTITGDFPKEMISLVNEKETVEVKENLEKPVSTFLIEGGGNYPIGDSTNLDEKGTAATITPIITGTLDSDIVDKFHQLVVAAFAEESNEGQTLAFPELLEIQRTIKKDYGLTWSEFYDYFGITNNGAMNTKTKYLLNISGIPHTLSRDSEEGIDYAHYSDITKG